MVANCHRFSQSESSTASETLSQAREAVGRGYEQAEQMVSQYPVSAVILAFGIGLGLGFLLDAAFMPEQRKFSELTTSEKAQRIGQQVLEAVGRVLPESLSSQLQR